MSGTSIIAKFSMSLSIKANIVDPDQTAPTGAVWSDSTLLVYEAFYALTSAGPRGF